ncbi:replication factor C subunit 4-like [Aedes albopictus]|uniref:AAA+ ATPase domain-containing protein n=1 Tax=Aedes albopictus TaxID=7160 RepID=A0ABM1YIM2_AEDAL
MGTKTTYLVPVYRKITDSPSKAGPNEGSSEKRTKLHSVPWLEQILSLSSLPSRPKSVDDVVEQAEVVAALRESLSTADLPNLLLYGPPGTGKTSTILAAARQLFGDMFKERILELNASGDRGIAVIRNKVKTFAQLTASGTRADGKPCPPFKIVILDEADAMTHAAQAALRRTMEKETKTTRKQNGQLWKAGGLRAESHLRCLHCWAVD